MKQKLLLLAAVLCSAFSAQAVVWTGETLGDDGVYYLYNVSAGVFLNSNGSVGTAPVDQWYFTNNGNGTWTVKALKLNNVITNTTPSGDSDYNYIWLDVSKSGLSVNYVDAYSKDTWTSDYDGASTNLTLKAGTTGDFPSYQFYFVRSWKDDLGWVTYYGSAFLAADVNGIKAVQGTRDANPTCNDNSSYWYLVKKDTYDEEADASYYFKVQSSATLGSSTDLSLDKFDEGDGHGGVTEGLGSTVQYQMKVPSDETVNVSIPVYAVAHPANDFVRFVGWKNAESDANYVSKENPYLANAPFAAGTTAGNPTLTLVAEFTQIYTDAPADGQYALYNPKYGVYLKDAGSSVTVTKNPTEATIYAVNSEGSWGTQTTTLKSGSTFLGQDRGSFNSSETEWVVEKQGEGYTLHKYQLTRYYYITNNGSNASLIRRNDISDYNECTWMFMEINHMNSIIENNTALLAVNANVGYGTFVAPFDVTLPTGVTAYTVTGFEGSTLTLANAANEGTLMANTAVILESSSNVYETVFGEAYGVENANSSEYLVGTYKRTAVPEGSYLLQNQDGHVAFFLVDGENGTLYSGKNRAYLTNVPEADSQGVKSFSLNGTETAIDEIIVVNEDTAIYDLSGRRLSKKPARGIYIQNGKKILVK